MSLDKTFVEELSNVVDDGLHGLVVLAALEYGVEEDGLVKVAEHVVDALLRLVGEVSAYDVVNGVVAHAQHVAQVLLLVGELDLVERERRLGERVKRLPEAVARAHLLVAELIVLEQDAYLEYDLDDVVEYALGLLLRAVRVLAYEST